MLDPRIDAVLRQFTFLLCVSYASCSSMVAPRTTNLHDYALTVKPPQPTAGPTALELKKRQTSGNPEAGFPSSICGYIGNDTGNPWACAENQYCGIATLSGLNMYGCCNSYTVNTVGQSVFYTVSDCTSMETTCVSYSAYAEYDPTQYLQLYCSDSAYPECIIAKSTSFNAALNQTLKNGWVAGCGTSFTNYFLSNPVPLSSMPLIPDAEVSASVSSLINYYLTISTWSYSSIPSGTVVGTGGAPGSGSSQSATSTATAATTTSTSGSIALQPASQQAAWWALSVGTLLALVS